MAGPISDWGRQQQRQQANQTLQSATIVKRYDPETQRTIFSTNDPVNVIDNNGRQFIYHPETNTRYEVTGPGTTKAVNMLYGQPITDVYLTRATRGPHIREFYGGPNQLELVIAGRKADPFTGEIVANPRSITTGAGTTVDPLERDRTAEQEIRISLGYLPDSLIDMVINEWEDTGSLELGVQKMRQSKEYKKHFPGMVRDDGTIRYANEQEYLSTTEAFNRYWKSFGTNSALPTNELARLHEGEVSPEEWNSRLTQRWAEIETNAPQVRAYFEANFGQQFSTPALFVSSVLGVNPIEATRQILNSQIGGTAAQYGFEMRMQEADRLRTFGLDQQASQRLFAQAQQDLPKLNSLLNRHNDADDDFSLDEFTDAIVVQDANQLTRLTRLLAAERSLYSRSQSVASEGINLTGLRR